MTFASVLTGFDRQDTRLQDKLLTQVQFPTDAAMSSDPMRFQSLVTLRPGLLSRSIHIACLLRTCGLIRQTERLWCMHGFVTTFYRNWYGCTGRWDAEVDGLQAFDG